MVDLAEVKGSIDWVREGVGHLILDGFDGAKLTLVAAFVTAAIRP
jgi:hypothetical protein